MEIGIPRALPGLLIGERLERFLRELGHDVVWSPPSDPGILLRGDAVAPHDLCLPVKLHMGHVLHLLERVDRVLVPRLLSLDAHRWLCPHFLGLPDTVIAMGADRGRILTATWDVRNDGDVAAGYRRLGQALGHGRGQIERALGASREPPPSAVPGEGKRIAVLGHPYIVEDPILSADMVRRIRRGGYDTVLAHHAPADRIEALCGELARDVFWYSARQLVGAGFHFLERGCQGVILISSFGCGPDSLIRELVEIRSRRQGRVPLLSLVVDEHMSGLGLETRIEAFFDMVETRTSSEARSSGEAAP